MAFSYLAAATDALRQGEILQNVREIRPKLDQGIYGLADMPSEARNYPFVLVVSADCDLFWDYDLKRQGSAPEHKRLNQVLLCELFERGDIRGADEGNVQLFNFIRKNQHERYHRFDQGTIGESDDVLPELYADFKRIIGLPIDVIYHQIDENVAVRFALLPESYTRHVMQRLFSFLSRVGLP